MSVLLAGERGPQSTSCLKLAGIIRESLLHGVVTHVQDTPDGQSMQFVFPCLQLSYVCIFREKQFLSQKQVGLYQQKHFCFL